MKSHYPHPHAGNTSAPLCAPTPGLTCFGCCPPIRPARYDHLDYVGSLRREFAENRRRYFEEGPRYRPIVGYHCWALGFLDPQGRRIGCLLHPCQNQGQDLRSLIDYGNKCMRESCLPAKTYACLPPEGQRFWLPLVEGLNAFHFSSPRANPLFHLLLWGPEVLEALRTRAEERKWTSTELLHRHPFLLDTECDPRSRRYLLHQLLELLSARELHSSSLDLRDCCQNLWSRALSLPEIQELQDSSRGTAQASYTHRLALDAGYLDFVRIGLGCKKAPLHLVLKLEARIRRLIVESVQIQG